MRKTVENRQEIARQIYGLAPQLRRHGVRRLALFGSFIRGAQHSESDVDLLVDFMPGQKTYDNLFATGELLEGALGRRVELLTRESLSPYIGPRILQEAEDVVFAD
jgi:uncharacterized protein